MTHGITDETADGMRLEKIDTIIEALRHERYHWKPARRVWIPQKNGKKRPLGVTTWSDKLVAEVVRMILDAYFDIQMSEQSHGFREGRGCGSALRESYYTWRERADSTVQQRDQKEGQSNVQKPDGARKTQIQSRKKGGC